MIGFSNELEASSTEGRLLSLTERSFASGGFLTELLGLEHRPQQQEMAQRIADAVGSDTPLLFEAGTGVGKSIAYLIPAIIHAMEAERKAIVSTHTIALQEQLEQKDLPLVRRLFSSTPSLHAYRDFRYAVLLGRSNYLCPNRLGQALGSQTELFPETEERELQRIAEWAATTRTGLRHELDPFPDHEVWDWVNSDSHACSRKYCSPESCFYQAAKARLRRAHLIIVNHSLLFALLGAAGSPGNARGVLFPDDFVIIDEAHTVPAIATEHFGLHVSSYGLNRLLLSLYHPKRKRGLLKRYGRNEDMLLVEDALEAAKQFFGFVRDPVLARREICRIREPDWCEPCLHSPLRGLTEALGRIGDRMEEGPARDEVKARQERVASYRHGISQMLSLSDEEHVYWVEKTGKKGNVITLRTAPLDVAAALRETLFQRKTGVVLTSATLAVAGKMEPFQTKTGAEAVAAGVVSSPFDYERNMRVYLAADVPLPTRDAGRLSLEALAQYLRFCLPAVPGGSLVLFTSYSDMQRTSVLVEESLRAADRPFYMQGRQHSRSALLKRFQEDGNAILFGTDSFWTGIDVPGDALSQVVITRLPFENPGHPLPEAKSEWIRERGGNPFEELSLPDALIKFRQGIGRLIRNILDRGIITVLDSRVVQKPYGRLFIESLPTSQYEILTRENLEDVFRAFR